MIFSLYGRYRGARKPGTDTKFPAPFAGNWLSVPGFAPGAPDRVNSIQNFDAILFDDRIGQHFVRDSLDVGLRLLPRDAARERDLEELALTDFGDPSEPEAVERRADRLALRVEDGGLGSYEYACFHGNSDYRMVRGVQSSRGMRGLESANPWRPGRSYSQAVRAHFGGKGTTRPRGRHFPRSPFYC